MRVNHRLVHGVGVMVVATGLAGIAHADEGKAKGADKKHEMEGMPHAAEKAADNRGAAAAAAPGQAKDKDKDKPVKAAAGATAAPNAMAAAQAAPPASTAADRLAALVAQRRALVAQTASVRAEIDKHVRSAVAAQKQYVGAAHKAAHGGKAEPGAKAPQEILGTASTEQAAAAAKTDELAKSTTQIDSVNSELAALVKAAEDLAAKTKADAEAAKQAANTAKQAAQEAARQLAKTRALAGLGEPAAAEAKHKHDSEAIEKLKAKVQELATQNAQLPAAAQK